MSTNWKAAIAAVAATAILAFAIGVFSFDGPTVATAAIFEARAAMGPDGMGTMRAPVRARL
jgi:hypothetical protein